MKEKTLRWVNPSMTKKQQAQSVRDKHRHERQSARAIAMQLLKPPIVVKPFSILNLPGTKTDALTLKHPNGVPRYVRTEAGGIRKIHARREGFVNK